MKNAESGGGRDSLLFHGRVKQLSYIALNEWGDCDLLALMLNTHHVSSMV